MANYTLNFDGSCGPKNPGGTAAYGFVLRDISNPASPTTGNGVIGTGPGMSNNLAEFVALAKGLIAYETVANRGDFLQVRGDSKLVIQVMNRKWRASSDKLYYEGYVLANELLINIRAKGVTVHFDHVYREMNQECDDLSKEHR